MAATPSQHPVSKDVAAHVPENAAAPIVSDNASQNIAEDAAPYQDEEMPDFSRMSFAEHIMWKLWQRQLFKWMHHLPRLKRKRKVMTMEEDVVTPVASPEPASIPDELEDSEEEESSEEEELDLDGKDLSTHFEITYHQSMVAMLQKALSDQKGGEKASHKVEAGTSHPLDARDREQGVNEEGAKNEGEAQEAEESSGSSASDGGTAADTEKTLDILL
ncbi:PREDICTED: uncharacterized protein LOC105972216 [Erythranthe guttata]|uniref:uncharacterized protein LOC105972216 n=1 Tax=Erythranthe guttata TaxID=4155 RepID=UPI00064DEA64|nr:PREDICTED: uncharacterized protein LOC105972216 [Erythranthe guttata]|eukprot:XP_012852605.1 PREDICTED: uncharacterized protein LOC105972216 [Erythranthe guttata]